MISFTASSSRAALVVGMWVLALSGFARADEHLDAIGGNGGGNFEAHCPAGQLLTGFDLRAADDVDAIRPLCVTASSRRSVSAAAAEDNWYGGSGGRPAKILCTRYNPIVTGMYVYADGEDTTVVNNIHLYCGEATNTEPPNEAASAFLDLPKFHDSGVFSTFISPMHGTQRCRSGQVAVGMHGRSGRWVDAIGLICGDPPPLIGKTLGRVPSSSPPHPPRPICDSARDARARNSPAAPNLEAQCAASKAHAKAAEKAVEKASAPPAIPAYLYAVDSAGELRWFRHDGAASGTFNWQGPRVVDVSWGNFRYVFPGGDDVIYAITQNGALMRYEHAGFENGLGKDDVGAWRAPQEILRGWGNVRQSFSAGNGVIYVITDDGRLLWYRHTGFSNGKAVVQGPKEVGHGWNGLQVFSGGDGVLYSIAPDGTLSWHHHVAYLTGDGSEKPGAWEARRQVGTGWNGFRRVFSAGNGVIYVITADGKLMWYHHRGYRDGRFAWDPEQQVGTGWTDMRWAFAQP